MGPKSNTSGNCNNRNPLVRSGTSQKDRLIRALQDGYVKIDEHTIEDLLVFAKKFAAQLKYYNVSDTLQGDWSDFFQDDISIILALITTHAPSSYTDGYIALEKKVGQELRALYDQTDGSGNLPPEILTQLSDHVPSFKSLFDYIFSIVAYLDKTLAALPDKVVLKAYSIGVIKQKCSLPIQQLLGIYKAGINDPGPDYQLIKKNQKTVAFRLKDIDQKFTQEVIERGLKLDWLSNQMELKDYFENQINSSDFEIAYGNAPTPMQKPEHIETRLLPVLKLVRNVFDQTIQTFEKIVTQTHQYFQQTINDWPEHKPHTGLYIAFLKLFSFAQAHLNGLLERHLTYYFRDVLRLKEKGPQPDQVHLILELAKNVDDHLLKTGIAFKGDKDSLSKQKFYSLTSDSTINKASISALQSHFFAKNSSKLFSSPITNSKDGFGEAFDSETDSWSPFGPASAFGPDSDSNLITPVAFGFAIASPILFMREGERKVFITLTTSGGEKVENISKWVGHLKVYFTGEEGWIEKYVTDDTTFKDGKLELACSAILPDEPAVIPYNAEIHGDAFNLVHPIVKIVLDNEDNQEAYTQLTKLKISTVTTKVVVSGIRNLTLQNSSSQLDPAKPFLPFGTQPHKGSSLIVGSNEVFSKPLIDDLVFNIEWDGLQDFTDPFLPSSDVNVTVMDIKGQKETGKNLLNKNLGTYKNQAVPQTSISVSAKEKYGAIGTAFGNFQHYEENPAYDIKAKDGFVLLTLEQDLGHLTYQKDFPLALIEMAKPTEDRDAAVISKLNFNFKDNFVVNNFIGDIDSVTLVNSPAIAEIIDSPSELLQDKFNWDLETQLNIAKAIYQSSNLLLKIPDPPYTPIIKSLTINYTAESTFNISQNFSISSNNKEYFLHIHPLGFKEVNKSLNGGKDITVLPVWPNEGELYIGIKGVSSRQQIAVLFQVAEGSANPLAEAQQVNWSYLQNNYWQDFNSEDLSDGTNGLLNSGIVKFLLPKNINSDNSWLAPDTIWLRASVVEKTDAICNFIQVLAPAISATFENRDNAPDVLNSPLKASTISKLEFSDSSIKKIQQPFSSFGGRTAEGSSQFFKRVSERLRHKDRGISIWDYERLTLEAFPQIYKAKCLNHTQVKPLSPADPDILIDNGMAPGYVLLVTIPDLKNSNTIDPLKPYTSLGTLNAIKQFLSKRISPHVNLDVRNPNFEAVQLDFKVQFKPLRDPTIYQKLLNQDIINFLSPWAFGDSKSKEIEFGGSIHKSVLLDFVEELEYVEFITDFKLNQNPDSMEGNKQLDIEEAKATSGRSVLVSHANHYIREVNENC